MAIKLETPVRQVMPAPIEGVIVQRRFKENADQMEYLVEWPDDDSDADSAPQQRWFLESELAVIGDQPKAADAAATTQGGA